MNAGRGFLWLPVAFGSGIAGYFLLPREPLLGALLAVAMVLTVLAWRIRSQRFWSPVLVMMAAIAIGAFAANWETDRLAQPRLEREMTVRVSATVIDVAARPGGAQRLTLTDIRFARSKAVPPDLIAVTARKFVGLPAAGQRVRLTARLIPPSGPVQPGTFDFARLAYYRGIGAYGFAYGAVTVLDPATLSTVEQLQSYISQVRQTIAVRIRGSLEGEAGEVAAALIVGDRGGISENTVQALRRSGLAHILAISGLHMALVAGTLFWVLRALLALNQTLALKYPIKKWAAAAALLVAAIYLVLSGAGIATQRAFIMTAVALAAIMLDRPALRLRSVAVAALIVMALAPHSIMEPGFQMSFAAAVALIAAYEVLAATRWRSRLVAGRGFGFIGTGLLYFSGIALTTLIAGLATAPFAAYHFNQVAPYGLIANALAMPIVSIAVMPLGLLAMLAAPFGLDPMVFAAMGQAIEGVISIAHMVDAWMEGGGTIARIPPLAPIAITCGLLWLSLWTARWRLMGLAAILVGLVIAPLAQKPQILVNQAGSLVAVRGHTGQLLLLPGRKDRLTREIWQRADGAPSPLAQAQQPDDARCDKFGCIVRIVPGEYKSADEERHPIIVAHVTNPNAFDDDCRIADIIISPHKAPRRCHNSAKVILDRELLKRRGATSIIVDWNTVPATINLNHARGKYPRPWH